jgi:hypothetical protein
MSAVEFDRIAKEHGARALTPEEKRLFAHIRR